MVINMAKGEGVSKERMEREEGYLYNLGSEGYVWQNPMKGNKTGKRKRVGTEKIEERAWLCIFCRRRRICRKGKKR
jgi:hypothetical protein